MGQQDSFGRQAEHTRCPDWHCWMGGRTWSKQTGHSKRLARSVEELAAEELAIFAAFLRFPASSPMAPRHLLLLPKNDQSNIRIHQEQLFLICISGSVGNLKTRTK